MLNIKKVFIVIAIIVVAVLIVVISIVKNHKVIDIGYKSNVNMNEIKTEKGIVGADELYEIVEENDGRKALETKKEYLYKVALIGLYTKERGIEFPNNAISTIENINQNYESAKNYLIIEDGGVIVPKKDQSKILDVINNNSNDDYYFDDNNHLKQTLSEDVNLSEFDQKLIEKINSNNTLILTYDRDYYWIDNVSGEIVNYPFCDLDPYIDYDEIGYEDYSIRVINPEIQDITFLVN